jgi:type VI protein secretion system component Hcp
VKTYADRERRPRRSESPASRIDTPRGFVELHRAVGNRAVGRILSLPGSTQMLQRWFGGWRLPVPARAESKFTATCSLEGGGFAKGTTFPIEAFHWGVQTAGKTSAKDFSVVKRLDDLSAKLFKAANEGTRIDKVTLVLTRGSTTTTYVFHDVYVAAVRPGGSIEGAAPVEQVLFNFGSVSYGPESEGAGSAGDPSVRDWSLSGPPG